MGGSLALALRDRCASVCGYDLDPDTIAQALDQKIINRPIDLTGDEVDLLILAAPVSAILVAERARDFSAVSLLDLGSPGAGCRAYAGADHQPLGGHPMRKETRVEWPTRSVSRLPVRADAAGATAQQFKHCARLSAHCTPDR
jgi:prephenate dehydrogenase